VKLIKSKKRIISFTGISAVVLALLFFFITSTPFHSLWRPFSSFLKHALLSELHVEVHVPALTGAEEKQTRIIYVLGGDFPALRERFGTAVWLVHNGLADKIALPNMPRWQNYLDADGKEVPYDRWVIQTLGQAGISRDQIVLIDLKEGFWGTRSEAQAFTRFLARTRYHEVILVSSAYHTRRAYLTFHNLLVPKSLKIYIYGSHGNWELRYLLLEVCKLLVYECWAAH
jgi:uncharacterized SAM-binding protein YcdF (DUF218 family)